jgi:hypothetical protein
MPFPEAWTPMNNYQQKEVEQDPETLSREMASSVNQPQNVAKVDPIQSSRERSKVIDTNFNLWIAL